MITIKTKYIHNEEDCSSDFSVTKYDFKDSDTIEHLVLIVFLINQIKGQAGFDDRTIMKLIKKTQKSTIPLEKEEFGNGKSSTKNE